jgi:polar amino acid transport system substrate-binding protein
MKIKILQKIFLILFIIPSVSVSSEELTFGYTEACPHMCPDNDDKGFTRDITKAVLEKYGHKVKFEAMPWFRAVNFANKGTLSGIICTGKEESPLLLYPEEEHGIQNDCFYGSVSDDWRPTDMSSFLRRKTIIFKGWMHEKSYMEKLGTDKYFKTFIEFSLEGDYTNRAMRMVEGGRVDAFWSDATVFKYFLSKNNLEHKWKKIKQLGCIKRQKLFMGISPKYPELATKINKQFDEGMIELRKSGELDKIMNKYGLTDWR